MVANESAKVADLRKRIRLLEGVLERIGGRILDGAAADEAAKLAAWIKARIGELGDRINAETDGAGDTAVIDSSRLVRWSRGEADCGDSFGDSFSD